MSGVEGQSAEALAPRPRVGRALRRGLQGIYEYLGTVLMASMLWAALAVLLGTGGSGLLWLVVGSRTPGGALLALVGGCVAAGIGTGPFTAALFHHIRRLLAHDDPRWWELPASAALLWRRGLALAGMQVGVALVLAVDAFFFLRQPGALLRFLGILFIYPFLIWASAALLQWPLAAERPGETVPAVVKKSLLLLLDNLGYVAVIAVMVAALTALCLATRIGLTLAWAGMLAFVQTAALRELLPKYGLLPREDEEGEG